MAKFLGIVELGTIFKNLEEQPIPTKPWYSNDHPNRDDRYGNGDILQLSNNFDGIKIGDTSLKKENRLRWIKIRDGNKLLYICDRCIFTYVSWDTLNKAGLIEGKNITIDGNIYKIRTITGGVSGRSSGHGCTPENNEWDRFIINEDKLEGLPIPEDRDYTTLKYDNSYYSSRNHYSDHSKTSHASFWNWWGIYNLTSNTNFIRGYDNCSYYTSTSSYGQTYGWRPVLEVVDTNKFLIKQDDKVYTIKTEYYNPLTCQYEPIKDIDANDITAEDFERYGFQDLENMYNEINKINYVMEPNEYNDGFHATVNENIRNLQDIQSEHKEV